VRTGGARLDHASIYDIAPTILHAMGLALGKDMDGHVLGDMFQGELAARQDALIETWDNGPTAGAASPALPADVDQKVLEHLRSLGYIGDK